MAKLFMANKDWLAVPFENRIQNVKRKLNLQTNQPIEVQDYPYKYYYSSPG